MQQLTQEGTLPSQNRKGNVMLTKPQILHETRNGIARYPIEDAMLKNRTVVLMGPVDEQCVDSLICQLLYLEDKAPGKEIRILINSGGGEVGRGLALYDVMQSITSPIHTICIGIAASMAAVLFAAGDKRELYPHSKIMIHDPSIAGTLFSKALELKNISDNLLTVRQSLAEILAKHTGQSIETILEKTNVDSYFDAESAVRFGLADSIIGACEKRC